MEFRIQIFHELKEVEQSIQFYNYQLIDSVPFSLQLCLSFLRQNFHFQFFFLLLFLCNKKESFNRSLNDFHYCLFNLNEILDQLCSFLKNYFQTKINWNFFANNENFETFTCQKVNILLAN